MKEGMRQNETGEGEKADRVMKRVTGRVRGRNKGMDRLTEGRRDGGKQTRAADICSPTGNTRRCSTSNYKRLCECFHSVEVSEYVPVIAKGK